MGKQINAFEYSIENIFSDDFEFHIPSYQRPYSWTTEQASDLFDDLLFHFDANGNEKEGYFLGSIVLIKEENLAHSDVVDGQQRLTTLTILLATLASFLSESEQKDVQPILVQQGNKLLNIENKGRLTLRHQDKDFFKKYVQDLKIAELLDLPLTSLDKESWRNIWENARHFTDKIKQRFYEQDRAVAAYEFIQFILKSCFLVAVSTPSQESAFRIFTVMNSRGLDLQATDIIKADLIGDLESEEESRYSDKWEEMEVNLTREGFNDLFTYIRMIYAKNKARFSLREEFKKHVLNRNSDPKKLIDDVLAPYSEVLRIIRTKSYKNGNEDENKGINELIGWLNFIDNSDWIPPAILYLHLNKNNPANVLKFFTKLERLAAFMQSASNQANININKRIEKYANLIVDIENKVDLGQMRTLDLDDTQIKHFLEALKGDVYKMAPKRRAYIMRRLDRFLADAGAIYDTRILTIEHVLPQEVEADSEWDRLWPNEDEREAWQDKIGNLVLLTKSKNSKAQNYDFRKKCDVYFKDDNKISPYVLTMQVLNENKWDIETVKKRQYDLLKIFKKGWQLHRDLGHCDPMRTADDMLDHRGIISNEFNKMPRESQIKPHEHMEQTHPDDGAVPYKARRKSNKISTIEPGTTRRCNRLKIWKHFIGKDITLRIQYKDSDEVFVIKHDTLVEIVKRIKPPAMESKSWIGRGEYHWPYIDKKMRSALIDGGYLIGSVDP